MPVAFKKFERDTTKIQELGTVKTLAGKGGAVSFLRKNFNDKNKLVALVVERKDGKSAVIPCSTQVTNLIRNKEINMRQLIGLQVIEFPHKTKLDEKGNPLLVCFVALPPEGGKQSFNVDDLQEETLELSDEFLPEELLQFA
jgi:hypothetical protein